MIARVYLDTQVPQLAGRFDYSIPKRLEGQIEVGSVVRVRVASAEMRAFVTDLPAEAEVDRVRPLSRHLGVLFDRATCDTAIWIADRSLAPVGLVLHRHAPGRWSTSAPAQVPNRIRWQPNPASADLINSGAPVVLDSSIDAVAAAVEGRRALVLVPRAPDADELARALGGVAYHASLGAPARAGVWTAAADGSADLIFATRSGLLMPVPDLETVVVVRPHDRGFATDLAPRFNVALAARQRAVVQGARCVVLDPAPPLELVVSTDVAEPARGDLTPVILPRPRDRMPEQMIESIRRCIAEGQDALVVAARKGSFQVRICSECDARVECPNCGTSIRGESSTPVCRACGVPTKVGVKCAKCGSARLASVGWGVDRIADVLSASDIDAPILRCDAATPLPARRPSPAVVVGTVAAMTQVSSAGTIVVCDYDSFLAVPDLRTAERAAALLFDLASRHPREMIVGTSDAAHHSVQALTRGSWRWFASRELARRRQFAQPPYHPASIASGKQTDLETLRAAVPDGVRFLGPRPVQGGPHAALLIGGDPGAVRRCLREWIDSGPDRKVDTSPWDLG